ncbi:uncharacterized protein LOC113552623 [Rhopalosiphum maidis]|uniref:uncharacterized protein LOC113552623 n=1 Tax=Rhopalosiphum maidis TaxID=43146 RepID=UPI000EFFD1DA|nr:uncharacterized protein LOC113552623 [Rhopalosiphum maidis]
MADVAIRWLCGTVALLTATAVVGRLPPVDDSWPVAYRRDGPTVIDVCRMTAVDLAQQPFALSVVALGPTPAGFLRSVHGMVGTAVLMHAPAADRGPDEARGADSGGRTVLVIVDGRPVDEVLGLIDGGAVAAAWDQKSHYVVWLIRQGVIVRSAIKTLFQTAWQKKWVANVVVIAYAAAYTYNPFRDSVTERPADAAVLRAVARLRMTDLNGHRVRICMFPTRLKAVKLPDGSYGGMDGIVAATLAKHMNFTPVYSEPSDGGKYGWAEANSEYTGLLGDLVYNKVDMAFNGVFLNAYESNNTIQYTTPVMFDELCFVVPKAQQMSQWRAIFTAFDVRLWYCLAGSFVVALSAWVLIRRTTNTSYSLTLLAINLFRVFLMVPLNRVPNNISERLMVVSTVLFGFIMATSLQAVMVKYLSYPKYERDVATVQELYDTGMPVLSASNNLILLFVSDERPVYVKMSDRFSIINNKSLDILGVVASKRTSAAIGRKNDLVEKIASSYVENNEVLLHIVDECPRSFHIVYLVRKDVPFIQVVDRIITTFVESGIVNSWFVHAKPFRPISDYHHRKDPHKVFTFKNVVIAFMCLTIGLTASAIVFVAELVYFHKFAGPENPRANTTGRRYPRNKNDIFYTTAARRFCYD